MKFGKKLDIIGPLTRINPIFTLIIMFLCLIVTPMHSQTFKSIQLNHGRVREAYSENLKSIEALLKNKGIEITEMEVFLRGIKHDKKLELFAKNKKDSTFQLIKQYDFCVLSGELGPKRKQGDMQVPEGFYHINRFNPSSIFFLSLGIDYPNLSDKKLSDAGDVGGDIFIHGDCVSVGCIPITDELIKELYVICVEARNNGQKEIPVHIFPFRMEGYSNNRLHYSTDMNRLQFWDSLVNGYQFFEERKELPKMKINASGYYYLDDNSPS